MSQKLISEIFNKNISDIEFEKLSLNIFKFQSQNCIPYKTYIKFLNRNFDNINNISQIPFMPIDFFKKFSVVSFGVKKTDLTFYSSGTENKELKSKHYIYDKNIYNRSILSSFHSVFGNPEEYSFLALLPSYIENQNSSLIYMVNLLMANNHKKKHGFFLDNFNDLHCQLSNNVSNGVKTILFGVSYALIDFANLFSFDLKNTTIIETGGMKGTRKETIKNELHSILKKKFNLTQIFSEYSMTELLSQAYTDGNSTIFKTPPWMKIFIREINDPFNYVAENQTGGINIIDLANFYSCSFIETKDLGKKHTNNSFEVLGRFDNSDIRGCNLLYQK